MTKEQLAAQITGREYPFDLSKNEESVASVNGLIVIFGASDDLMEFRGRIHDEIGAYDGTTAYIHRSDILQPHNDCECRYCGYEKWKAQCATVRAAWSPKKPECSWLISSPVSHATFDIMEEGELYCRGIVISVADLPEVVVA